MKNCGNLLLRDKTISVKSNQDKHITIQKYTPTDCFISDFAHWEIFYEERDLLLYCFCFDLCMTSLFLSCSVQNPVS